MQKPINKAYEKIVKGKNKKKVEKYLKELEKEWRNNPKNKEIALEYACALIYRGLEELKRYKFKASKIKLRKIKKANYFFDKAINIIDISRIENRIKKDEEYQLIYDIYQQRKKK